MFNLLQISMKAFVVGVAVVIVGVIISWIISLIWRKSVPEQCRGWNKNHVMEITLFIIGITTYLVFESSGINKLYCQKN